METKKKQTTENYIKEIRRKTRRIFSSEQKITVIMEALRAETTIAELCRKYSIQESQFYKWNKEFLEAGKKRLSGDITREATSDEVTDLRKENQQLKEALADLVQMRMKNIYTSEDGKIPKFYERNKVSVKYDLNKFINPYVAFELYYPFYQEKHRGFSKSRSIIGLDYKITKKTDAEVYFLYQQKLNAFNQTNRDFVYGLELSHQF